MGCRVSLRLFLTSWRFPATMRGRLRGVSSLLALRLLEVHLRNWKLLHDGGLGMISRSQEREGTQGTIS